MAVVEIADMEVVPELGVPLEVDVRFRRHGRGYR